MRILLALVLCGCCNPVVVCVDEPDINARVCAESLIQAEK